MTHAVTTIEKAHLRTLYLLDGQLEGPAWQQDRVLEVSGLLRALILELSALPDPQPDADLAERERQLDISRLIVRELQRARPLSLGIALPATRACKSLCEAMLESPSRHSGFEAWAAEVGASPAPSRACSATNSAPASPSGARNCCWPTP